MDQTAKPLLIPPEFALYAEKHGIFELYQVGVNFVRWTFFEGFDSVLLDFKRLLGQLIIHKPNDPLDFMTEFIKKDIDGKPHLLTDSEG